MKKASVDTRAQPTRDFGLTARSLTAESGRKAVHGPTVAGFGHCGAHDRFPIGSDIDQPVVVLGHDPRSPDRPVAVLDAEQLMDCAVMISAAGLGRDLLCVQLF